MSPVNYRGPLFDGTAAKQLRAGAEAVEQDVAEQMRDLVRQTLRASAKHPTGRYESRVRVDAAGGDRVVTDTGVVYADWLGRGDTPRNRSTGFRGYQHFERAADRIRPQVVTIAERTLAPYINRMK
jgi:hypothetical protein